MLLTKSQLYTFWRQWNALVATARWTREEAEIERHALLARAGFSSLTQVDKLKGFDRVLAELKALTHPTSVDAQLRQQSQPLIRLRYRIRHHHLPEAYWHQLAVDRFGTADLDQLTEAQLTQLRNTLDDRLVQQRRAATPAVRSARNQARRQAAAANPEQRIHFPSSAIGNAAIGDPEISAPSDPCPVCGSERNLDGYCEECEEAASQRRYAERHHLAESEPADCPF